MIAHLLDSVKISAPTIKHSAQKQKCFEKSASIFAVTSGGWRQIHIHSIFSKHSAPVRKIIAIGIVSNLSAANKWRHRFSLRRANDSRPVVCKLVNGTFFNPFFTAANKWRHRFSLRRANDSRPVVCKLVNGTFFNPFFTSRWNTQLNVKEETCNNACLSTERGLNWVT